MVVCVVVVVVEVGGFVKILFDLSKIQVVWFVRKSGKVKMECWLDVLWLFYYEMEDCNC